MARGRFRHVDEEETRQGSLTVWILFLAGMAMTVSLALLTPDDVLTRNPWLQGGVDAVASVILFIDIFAEISRFPEVARLVIAAGWCLVPLQIAWALAGGAYRYPWERFHDRPVFMTTLGLLLLAAFVLPAIYWIGPEITAQDLEPVRGLRRNLRMGAILRFAAGDRLGLGVITGIVTGLMAWTLGLVLVWVRHFPYIYFGADKPGK